MDSNNVFKGFQMEQEKENVTDDSRWFWYEGKIQMVKIKH